MQRIYIEELVKKEFGDNAHVACTSCNGNCWGCLYSDECERWNDTGYAVPVVENGYIIGMVG